MLKAYKYRLYPTKGQVIEIEKHFGCCRLIWNLALTAKQYAYATNRTNASRYDLQKQLIDLKTEYDWLYEINAQSLQSVLLKLDVAYKSFFSGGGFPKYKGRKGTQSFQCPQRVSVDFGCGIIKLPKIGIVKSILSRKFTGQIKTCTVSRTPTGKYYVSILVDNKKELSVKTAIKEQTTIGIDVGISNYVVSSDGRVFEPNRKLKDNLKRLKTLQRRTSRKKKGSNNKRKSNLRLARLHEKITCKRLDYIHKVTNALIRDNQVESIVIEDLNVSGLLRNHKIAQAMADVSIGQLLTTLQYKCDWYGKNLIKIGRFDPSSKRCSCCGTINNNLTLADRTWNCEVCNTEHDRDFNAALNIKHYGLQQTIFKNKTPEGYPGRACGAANKSSDEEAGNLKMRHYQGACKRNHRGIKASFPGKDQTSLSS